MHYQNSHLQKFQQSWLYKGQYDEFKKDIEITRHNVAKGGFGYVHYGIYKPKKQQIAIKQAKPDTEIEDIQQELQNLEKIKDSCPYIIPCIGVYAWVLQQDISQQIQVLIIFPQAESDIYNLCKNGTKFSELESAEILKHVLLGLKFLKSKIGMIHRDIKPQNILIMNNNTYCIADFGISKILDIKMDSRHITTAKLKTTNIQALSKEYAAPEVKMLFELSEEKNSQNNLINVDGVNILKGDIFSLGITCLHVLFFSQNINLKGMNDNQGQALIEPWLKKIKNIYLRKSLIGMLEQDPISRFNIEQSIETLYQAFSAFELSGQMLKKNSEELNIMKRKFDEQIQKESVIQADVINIRSENSDLDKMIQDMMAYIKSRINPDSTERIKVKEQFTSPLIQIDCQKLEDIKNGFDVKYDTEIPLDEILVKRRARYLVGVIGSSKSGKSYLLSRLSGKNIRQGQLYKTEGINFITSDDYRLLYIDTQAYGEPLQCFKTLQYLRQKQHQTQSIAGLLQEEINVRPQLNKTAQVDICARDIKQQILGMKKQRQELQNSYILIDDFIQSYVLQESDMIIMIVGLMTSEDERIINQIMQWQKKYGRRIKLVIVHNFQHLTSVKDVQEYIQKDILACFPVDWFAVYQIDHQYTSCYTDPSISDQNPVRHYIFAQEGSEAGSIFNKRSIEHIHHDICEIYSREQSETIEERFSEFMSLYLPNYLEPKLKRQDLDISGIQEDIENKIESLKRQIEEIQKKQDPNSQIIPLNAKQRKQQQDEKKQLMLNKQYNFQTLFVPDFANRRGKIICELFRHPEIQIIQNIPKLQIARDIQIQPSYGIVQPEYIAIDNKQTQHMHFFIEVPSSQNLEAKLQTMNINGILNRCILVRGIKKLSNQSYIGNQQQIQAQSVELIEQGKIELKIRLQGDKDHSYNGRRELIKKIHSNGIFEVAISYAIDDEDY